MKHQIDSNMKFNCKEVSIADEEIGCTITFSENIDDYMLAEKQSIAEIIASMGQYIMLQRTYPEDDFEDDFYYFETNEHDKSGELTDFKIDLSRTQFIMSFNNDLYDIHIHIDDHEFEILKSALAKIACGKGQLCFQD